MSEIIKVKILEDGVSCREVNAIGEKDPYQGQPTGGYFDIQKLSEEWQEAESKLRTFNIVKYAFPLDEEPKRKCEYEPGSTHQAEVINETEIRII